MRNLTTKKLSELLTIKNGSDYKHLNTGNIPLLGSGGIMGYVDDKLYDKKSILLPRKGTLGNIMFIESPFWTVDTLYWSEINEEEVSPYYLYLYLSLLDLSPISTGSTLPSMTMGAYYSLEIDLPDRKHQDKIADFIYKIDSLIKNNNLLIETINNHMKLLYNYWFIQFDFPDENGKPYKSSGGKMVWNEKLKREIPEGWEVKNIEELVLYEKGFEPGAKNYSDEFKEGYLPFYRVGELGSGVPIYIPNFDTIRESQIANFGDVLISFDGSIGRISVSVDGVFSSGIQKATSIVEYINDALIYTISKNDYFQQVLDRHATGSIIKHASNSKKYLDLPIDKDIMLEFSKTIKPLFDKIILLEKENLELIKQRDFLLPLLMNGQVTIK